MKFLLLFIMSMLFAASCGYYSKKTTVVRYEDPTGSVDAYTFDDMKKACFSCHNSTAPEIPTDEEAFKKSEKALKRIKDDSMPPNKDGWDKEKALKYLEGK